MRFLVDECVGPTVAAWLRSEHHEVFSVYDQSRGMNDEEIIQKAYSDNWILVTNDKDFGEKIFRELHPHHGVILLRLDNQRLEIRIKIINKLLENYSEQLPDNFVVVSQTKVRFISP